MRASPLQQEIRSQVYPRRSCLTWPTIRRWRDGAEAEKRSRRNPVLDPPLNVSADAGEQAGANQRDRQPVPDQADIVGGEMIERGPESGQEQSDQEQPVAGHPARKMVAGASGPQCQPAPDRDQSEPALENTSAA